MNFRAILLLVLSFLLSSCATWFSDDKEAAILYLQNGVASLNSGNYPEALIALKKAEQMDPENPAIENNLALVYYARERFELAETHIRKAISLNNKYSDARNNLSAILLELGKYQEAAKEAKIVMNDLTYPNPEKPWVNYGLALFKMNDFNGAKNAFAKAVDYQRDSCEAQSNYGRALYELKDYRKASDALDRAIGFCQRTQFDEPHYYSALSYYQLGEVDKAKSRLDEVIKFYPNGKYIDKAKGLLETINK